MTNDNPDLTITEAFRLAELVNAVKTNANLTLYSDTSFNNPINGVVRYFSNGPDNDYLWRDHDGDIRDAYVRVSGTLEHWFKVRDLLTAIDQLRAEFRER